MWCEWQLRYQHMHNILPFHTLRCHIKMSAFCIEYTISQNDLHNCKKMLVTLTEITVVVWMHLKQMTGSGLQRHRRVLELHMSSHWNSNNLHLHFLGLSPNPPYWFKNKAASFRPINHRGMNPTTISVLLWFFSLTAVTPRSILLVGIYPVIYTFGWEELSSQIPRKRVHKIKSKQFRWTSEK